MLMKDFLTLGTLSLLLSSTLLGGEVEPCPDCFATFSSSVVKVETTSTTTPPCPDCVANLSNLKPLQEVTPVRQEEASIVSVIAPVDNAALMITFSEGLEEETTLPVAQFYCDQNKIPVYENDSELFTCM